MNNANLIDLIYQDCRNHKVLTHPLLSNIDKGVITTKKMAHIVKAYVAYSVNFPKIISDVIDQWDWHPNTMRLLLQLLGEEKDLGGKTHAQQLASCADSLDAPYEQALLNRLELHCTNYATQISVMIKEEKAFALGMIGPGTENIVPILYKPFLCWLQKFAPNSDDTFFREHSTLDIEHSALLRSCIDIEVKEGSVIKLREGAEYALNQRSVLLDNILVETR